MQTATVTQVDYKNNRVKVTVPEQDNIETDWLVLSDTEYNLPAIGAQVMVSFEDDEYSTGYCHGTYSYGENIPQNGGPGIYQKEMAGDVVLRYDSNTKTLEIVAKNIQITGNIMVVGNVIVEGKVTADKVTEKG